MLSVPDPRIPANRRGWIVDYRLGVVENIWDNFDCDVPGCRCVFGNLADFLNHWAYGKHGRLGDRDAEMKRVTHRYYTRGGRAKEELYRGQGKSDENPEQASL